jgi:hypothetical protein
VSDIDPVMSGNVGGDGKNLDDLTGPLVLILTLTILVQLARNNLHLSIYLILNQLIL